MSLESTNLICHTSDLCQNHSSSLSHFRSSTVNSYIIIIENENGTLIN